MLKRRAVGCRALVVAWCIATRASGRTQPAQNGSRTFSRLLSASDFKTHEGTVAAPPGHRSRQRCKSRAGVYGAAWLSQASTLAAIPDFVDKEALEYATFHLHQYASVSLKTVKDVFWTNHVSGYEHNLWPRYGDGVAKERVTAMLKNLQKGLCGPRRDAFHASARGGATLVAVPFYGGRARDGNRSASAADKASMANTGTAHSRADRGVKLRTLHAVLCSGLRVARSALVGVCTRRDYDDVAQAVLARLPRDRAAVELLDCGAAPGHLPFHLLRRVQAALRGATGSWIDGRKPVDYVLYDEADQTLHFESGRDLAHVFAVLDAVGRSFVVPQRYEKRWGADPALVDQKNLSRSMNKCPTNKSPPIFQDAT